MSIKVIFFADFIESTSILAHYTIFRKQISKIVQETIFYNQ
jgi:hypothetical protein